MVGLFVLGFFLATVRGHDGFEFWVFIGPKAGC